MSEPIVIRPNLVNVVISTDEVSDATALRELADWLDAQPGDPTVLSVATVNTINHGGQRLAEDRDLSAVIELERNQLTESKINE